MTTSKLVQVLNYYKEALVSKGFCCKFNADDSKNKEAMLNHCVWMCVQALDFIAEGRIDKAMRWLGFIQGTLHVYQIYNINQLRAHSRSDEDDNGIM
jgi:hypothetical protein